MGNMPFLEKNKYWWECSVGLYENTRWVPSYFYSNLNGNGTKGIVLTLEFLRIRLHIVVEKIVDWDRYLKAYYTKGWVKNADA